MIEIIYNKEKEKAVGNEEYFCVPKNIRQIGDVPKENKIYIEDYVYTYLTSDWKDEEPKGKIAILLGKYNWKNGVSYTFIKSAVMVDNIVVSKEHCPLTDAVWGAVYEEMKSYFPGQEVVGWYLSIPDGGIRTNDVIVRTHIKHFGGNDKALLLADPYERESTFFLYKNNRMEKQEGYYLFYEKNDLMQEYMLTKNPQAEVDYAGKAQDRAVKDFRKIIARKQEEHSVRDGKLSWGIVACMGIAALSLAAGTFWLNSRGDSDEEMAALNSEEAATYIEEMQINEQYADEQNIEEQNTEEQNAEEDDMVLLTPKITGDSENQNEAAAENGLENPAALEQNTDEMSGASNAQNENEQTAEPDQETSISVYTKYTVRSGDTLSKISMRYYGDFSRVTEICKINNLLEEDVIYPGQTILLP